MKRTWPALALLALACEDPLKEAQLLEEPRVLGIRVATSGEQASLEPGQSAEVEVLLAGPEGPVDARLAYAVCEAVHSDRGVPFCQGEAFASAIVDADGAPIAIDVPAVLPEDARLALHGVACLSGEPELGPDPLEWSCDGDTSPLRMSFDAWISAADFVNQTPDLSALTVTVGGADVPLDDPHAAAACDPGTTEVAAGTTHRVAFALGEGAREPGEVLQLSHFSSSGLYERQYDFAETSAEPSASLGWRAPAADSAAKHYLVVRDGRGGVSWASFSVCAR